jgi:multidrug resistance efflux pump
MKNKTAILALIVAISVLMTACSGIAGNNENKLTASGTISAESVNIAPEISGMVNEVFVKEGAMVSEGDVLFAIDSEYLQAQLDQAKAAEESAAAALATAKTQQGNADLQLQMAVQNIRLQDSQAIDDELRDNQPGAFDLPVWYFTKEEEIQTAQDAIDKAEDELLDSETALKDVLADIVNSEFIALEKELAAAQNDYIVADAALDTVSRASDNTELKDKAQDIFDLSETTLEDVQERYDQALDTDAAEDVLEARAAVIVAQAIYDEAINQLNSFYVGDDSLQVQSARANAELAAKNIVQAEAGLKQTQTAATAVEIQLAKTSVTAPISGQVLSQNIEEGELVGAGSVVMTVGNYDTVNIIVYIPEDEYGRIKLDQHVNVSVDSFPETTFRGSVTWISDEAEYTPSNVQTVEGRKSTVFAVKITVENNSNELKPGMPADIEFLFD